MIGQVATTIVVAQIKARRKGRRIQSGRHQRPDEEHRQGDTGDVAGKRPVGHEPHSFRSARAPLW